MTEKNLYDKIYRWILIVPALVLIFSIFQLVQFYKIHGDIIQKDVSLTGGTTITVFEKDIFVKDIEGEIKKEFPDASIRGISDIRTGKQEGFFVDSTIEAQELKEGLEKILNYKLTNENSSIEFTGAALSSGFYQQLQKAVFFAFLFMAIVVFITFRTFVPSITVILCAFTDIVMTIATVNLIGMDISSAGIVAFLMLIGYSVDTDILLTSRVLKRTEGSVNEKIFGAFKTGITMTLTSIVAVGASLIIIYNFSDALRQIFSILLIGLGFDIFNTWITNASIIKWYVERKQ